VIRAVVVLLSLWSCYAWSQDGITTCYKDDFFGCETCVNSTLGDGAVHYIQVKSPDSCLAARSQELLGALGEIDWLGTGFGNSNNLDDFRDPPNDHLNQYTEYQALAFQALAGLATYQERVDQLNDNATDVVNRFKAVLNQNLAEVQRRNANLDAAIQNLNTDIRAQYEEVARLNASSARDLRRDIQALNQRVKAVSLDTRTIANSLQEKHWRPPSEPYQFQGLQDELRARNESVYQQLRSVFPSSRDRRLAKEMGISATIVSDQFHQEGEPEIAERSTEIGESLLDFVLGVTPIVSVGKDAYELFIGENLVTGEKLSEFDRAMAGVGLITLGGGYFVKGGIKLVNRFGRVLGRGAIRYSVKGSRLAIKAASNIAQAAVDLGLRGRAEISRFASLSRQVFMIDTHTYSNISRIVESVANVSPKLGDTYLLDLPDLRTYSRIREAEYHKAFFGRIHQGNYEPGELLFQAMRQGQQNPGRWFGPIKPINAEHADELYNIFKYKNDAAQLRVFKVTEKVSGYAGKVRGGDGHQFFIPFEIPLDQVLEEIKF